MENTDIVSTPRNASLDCIGQYCLLTGKKGYAIVILDIIILNTAN